MEDEGLLRKRVRDWLNSIGIIPVDLKIYIQGLTHRSFAKQINIRSRGNEQLEFLGDSILSFVVTSHLYKKYSYYPEGKLSRIRSSLVNQRTLLVLAKKIKIDQQVLLSENEESSKGRYKASILVDSFEALVGAVYIDKEIEFTYKWVLDCYADMIEQKIDAPEITNYKTYLQEMIQSDRNKLVKYRLEKSEGPSHDMVFYSAAILDENIIGRGKGKSKKLSEQAAARDAIDSLYNEKK